MVLRMVVGVAWSLVTGLAGGWLLLSPWALGEQSGSVDWTTITKTQFWTGAGLVALAVIGLAVLAAQVAGVMRGTTASQPAGFRGRPAESGRTSAEMDAALVSLANALVADLNRQPGAATPAPPPQGAMPPPAPMAPPTNGPPYTQVPQPPPAAGEPWRSR
jgi:hypothetical protein